MYHKLAVVLPLKEASNLDKLFENTLNQIVVGSVYKDTALAQSGYRYFKVWAKQENQFAHFSKKKLTNQILFWIVEFGPPQILQWNIK